MKTELISVLAAYGYPVMLQGSMAADADYPPAFFTFWNDETPDGNHYDNDAAAFNWRFSVYFYANDPTLVNTMMPQLRSDLRAAGFIVSGVGYDVASDEPTHTGRGIDVYYHQINTLTGGK